MKKILIVANPKAGNQDLLQDLDYITGRFRKLAPTVDVQITKRPGDGVQIIREWGEETDLMIAVGGDGTVYECVNALAKLKEPPPLAILPGGTCNDFARTLGISQDYREAVEQILRQKERRIDLGKHDDQFFLNFWGIGLITQVSQGIQSDLKQKFGRLSYYLSAVQSVLDQQPFVLEVESDTMAYQGEATMMLVGNGSYIGGMNAYFPHSSVEDGWLDVLIFNEVSLDSLWSMLTSYLMDENPEGGDLLYFHAKELHVKTSPTLKVDCDGEKNSFTPAILSVLPKHLRMIVGDEEVLDQRKKVNS